jgi:hypothetical protein
MAALAHGGVSRRHETEMLLHWQEISVVMQQGVLILDAESANDNVGRLADLDAKSSQSAIITGGPGSEVGAQKLHERIPAQCALNTRSMFLIPRALKHLEQNEVADQQRLAASFRLQLGGRRSTVAPQMRDPHGAVDKYHDLRRGRP